MTRTHRSFGRSFGRHALLVLAVLAVAGGPALAENDTSGKKLQCVQLQYVDQTPVIDDSTVLIRLKGGSYKRMDMMQPCIGLKIQGGFAFDTSTQDICTTNALHVLDHGSTCMIKDIVDISKDEAKALQKRR